MECNHTIISNKITYKRSNKKIIFLIIVTMLAIFDSYLQTLKLLKYDLNNLHGFLMQFTYIYLQILEILTNFGLLISQKDKKKTIALLNDWLNLNLEEYVNEEGFRNSQIQKLFEMKSHNIIFVMNIYFQPFFILFLCLIETSFYGKGDSLLEKFSYVFSLSSNLYVFLCVTYQSFPLIALYDRGLQRIYLIAKKSLNDRLESNGVNSVKRCEILLKKICKAMIKCSKIENKYSDFVRNVSILIITAAPVNIVVGLIDLYNGISSLEKTTTEMALKIFILFIMFLFIIFPIIMNQRNTYMLRFHVSKETKFLLYVFKSSFTFFL